MLLDEKILVIDIETTGLDPWRDEILMVGLYDGETYTCCRTKDQFVQALARYDQAHWTLCGHNFAFDVRFLIVKQWLNEIPRMHCTQLLAHTFSTKVPKDYLENYELRRKELNKTLPHGVTHRQGKGLSLKVLAPYFLEVEPFWETPGNYDNEEYNRKDCEYTYRLYQYINARLTTQEGQFYEERMLPWSRMLLEATLRGIGMNAWRLDTMAAEAAKHEHELSQELDKVWADAHKAYHEMGVRALNVKYQEMAAKALEKAKIKDPFRTAAKYNNLLASATGKLDKRINYDSPKQMLWLLKDHLGLNVTKIDDEEEESTGKAVLHQLASQGRQDIATFLEWRKQQKVLTGFLPTYLTLMVNGRLHPTFNLTGTRTGRTSSSKPNLQQVPPGLYSLFQPTKDFEFIQYDLSGIEAALIALYSDDKTLYDIISSGTSIHDHNTKVLFGFKDPVEKIKELYPKQRQTVKNVGFACFYGAGANRIETVFKTAGFMIDKAEAKKMLNRLKKEYSGVFSFHKEITEVFEAKEQVSNLLGRPLVIPEREDCYMRGFNSLIQSSASDLNLHAGYKASNLWRAQGIDAHALLFIHDCIVAEARSAQAGAAERILVDSMTSYNLECKWGKIKLGVEGGRGQEWKK